MLVVEPDSDTAVMYEFVLQPHFRVQHVAPLEAVATVVSTRPFAVITELVLPLVDSFAFCATVHEHDPSCVLVAATGRRELVGGAFDAGCHTVMIKPFNPDRLRRRLAAFSRRWPTRVIENRGVKPAEDRRRVLRPLTKPDQSPCPRCGRFAAEVFDHRWGGGGVWLVCRSCRHVWLAPAAGRRRRDRL